MLNRFDISDQDRQPTPASVQQAFSSLHRELLLIEMRASAYERQLAQLREQVSRIDDPKAELAELRERLGQNSNNSSKPPSTDQAHSPQKNSYETTGRGGGKQRGQEGFGRKLKSLEQVDHIVDLRPVRCKSCDHLLIGGDADPARHQVSEMVRPTVTIKEYRRDSLHRLVCATANKAAARKALELDETLAEAHTSLAQALFAYDWNFAESSREFQRAIELNPNYATTRHWYSNSTLLKLRSTIVMI